MNREEFSRDKPRAVLDPDLIDEIRTTIRAALTESIASVSDSIKREYSAAAGPDRKRLHDLEQELGRIVARLTLLEQGVAARSAIVEDVATAVEAAIREPGTMVVDDEAAPADDRMPVFGIVDPFTRSCLSHEVALECEHGPEDWRRRIEMRRPAFVFVESAWNGNAGRWQYRIAAYQKKFHDAVGDVLEYCKKNDIPTVFWNKEDPFHFERFLHNSKRFDLVVTTDETCVERYVEAGVAGKAIALPFAAQPALHNPLLTSPRMHSVAFAGSYYADRHDERRADMEAIIDPARAFDLHLYDRGGDPTAKKTDVVRWPDKYQPHIAGNLPYDLVVEAYRRYKVFLNVNSIKNSPTMFSRRVLELLACGTPVISSPSLGITRLFDDVVLVSSEAGETKAYLDSLLGDEMEWARRSALGIRRVMSRHTYAHMLDRICSEIGVDPGRAPEPMTVLFKVEGDDGDFERVAASIGSQSLVPDRVVLVSMDQKSRAERLASFLPKDTAIEEIAWEKGSRAPEVARAAKAGKGLVAVMSTKATYGANYLEDIRNALKFWSGGFVGKHTHFEADRLLNGGFEHVGVSGVVSSSLGVRARDLDTAVVREVMNKSWFKGKESLLALHRFSYAAGAVDAREHPGFVI